MGIDKSIFRSYDIRGLYPAEINEEAAFLIGQALVRMTNAKTLVVGRDVRVSSPAMYEELIRGAMSQGADVIDIGVVSTPLFYFAVGDYDLHDAGAMITASHMTKEYNGVKLCNGDVSPIAANSGIFDLRDIAVAGPYPDAPTGVRVQTDVKEDYLDRIFQGIDVAAIKPLKIVVDGGNGMAGAIIKDVFSRLPQCQVEYLYIEPDCTFPNHESNPIKYETLVDLQKRVVETAADLGVAFDGDADRIGFVDNQGEIVRGDIIHAMLVGQMLSRNPGATICYTVNETWAVLEEIEKGGGRGVMTPIGHGLIKPVMRREDAVFGGELSGHYFYRDFYTAESTDLTMLLILETLSKVGVPMSEIVAPLKRYFHSGEINSKVADKDAVFARIREKYSAGATVTDIDGLRYEYRDPSNPREDWWFSVRPSANDPVMRLNLEAKYREKMESKRDELLGVIRA
ncbi:MAG: phosphomannomutase/phosphoglucomutase [Patescibacteria group bacterium]|nr:phosphomannomutase/phosphoglucomutase [Patescibacteria group bacterium]